MQTVRRRRGHLRPRRLSSPPADRPSRADERRRQGAAVHLAISAKACARLGAPPTGDPAYASWRWLHVMSRGIDSELDRAAAWVKQHDFQRVSVQVPDEFLQDAARAIARLTSALPGRKVFLLGDSAYGSSSVDEACDTLLACALG